MNKFYLLAKNTYKTCTLGYNNRINVRRDRQTDRRTEEHQTDAYRLPLTAEDAASVINISLEAYQQQSDRILSIGYASTHYMYTATNSTDRLLARTAETLLLFPWYSHLPCPSA